MKSNSDFTALGLTDFDLLKSRHANSGEDYYKAIISPQHPGIGEPIFSATRHLYFGSKTTFSVIGQYITPEVAEIISFVISRDLKDGTHKIGGAGSPVQGVMTMSSRVLYASTGEITFVRDKANDSITATFNFEVEFDQQKYQVKEGKLFVGATGPL
ncbi:hypothetical protein [Pseudomonas sp. AKS31]|uniref:hypothetical protein n=1 Tax=Pseudomonas sp. AKS31 TaxID=2949091 RepID=UPI00202A041A|nr:hypothetical protein [Pseudomonas sp. AKS31]MCL9800015.1 hypothetical protein [Pseudomonas sp. AKS31]